MSTHHTSTLLRRLKYDIDAAARHSYRNFSANKHKTKDVSPVMSSEILHILNSRYPSGIFLDASFGEGGHSINLIKSSYDNKVIGLDCDHTISKKTAGYLQHKYRESKRFKFVHSKWSNMLPNLAEKLPEISETNALFDGILLETGTASLHEKIRHRGLIFDTKTSNLDMRYYTTTPKHSSLAVRDLLNHKNITTEHLANIISIFADQNIALSTEIAQGIISSEKEIATMEDIVCVIAHVLNKMQTNHSNPLFLFNKRKASMIRSDHPIKKTLYGLIRFINNSFTELSLALRQSELLLKPNGVLIVVCYDHLESRIIADFLQSRMLLNLDPDNKTEKAIVYVDIEKGETIDTTFVICDDTVFLKQRNERLGDNDWAGIGTARFNDYNAVPFIQPHIAEISSHTKGKYARMLILQRTTLKSNEDATVFMDNEQSLETQTLTSSNLIDVIQARTETTQKLLQCPSHNCFMR